MQKRGGGEEVVIPKSEVIVALAGLLAVAYLTERHRSRASAEGSKVMSARKNLSFKKKALPKKYYTAYTIKKCT